MNKTVSTILMVVAFGVVLVAMRLGFDHFVLHR